MTHPLEQLLEWLPGLDFAVLAHGFRDHGRDYSILIEDCLGGDPGQHELVFTHCVRADYETRVADDVWPRSWRDEFTDYQRWQEAGEPDGYVWGTKWSNAYPGLEAVKNSDIAEEWTRRLGKEMFEATLGTDRFFLRLVFHSMRSKKISDSTATISRITTSLKGDNAKDAAADADKPHRSRGRASTSP